MDALVFEMGRYANYSESSKSRSVEFIKTLSVGDKLWPKSHHCELTVSSVWAQGHDAIAYEESMWIHMYPQPDQFYSPLSVLWIKLKVELLQCSWGG